MTALGLLTGMVQAYIFSILAAVYIAAATLATQAEGRLAAGRWRSLKSQPRKKRTFLWIARHLSQ
jgi:hypothetical protein